MSPSLSSARIDAATLDHWLHDRDDVRVLDVRSTAEFAAVHIPGAYNVPLETVGEHAEEIHRHVTETIVVVCRSGARASQAEQRLTATGMGNIKVLDGGMVAWQTDHTRPVNHGAPRWDLERQVRLVAGSIVLASVAASIWAPNARYVAGVIGAGLVAASLTSTCLMGRLLSNLPYNRGPACDVDAVVARLTGSDKAANPARRGPDR